MKSFQELYTELQDITGDDSAATLTIFKRWINDTNQGVCGFAAWPFMELTATEATVASQKNYKIPGRMRSILSSIKVAVGDSIYLPDPVESEQSWEYYQSLQAGTDDIPQKYHRRGNEVLIWPTPATASNTITFFGRKRPRHLSLADYTTGTIAAATNGSRTITGTGTPAWADGLVGNWIRIDYTNGDYFWYEIETVDSVTQLTLAREYAGTTFSAQTEGYTIGEFSDIPSEYHQILIYRPLALYYASQEDFTAADRYWRLYDGGLEAGLLRKGDMPGGMLGKMLSEELQKNEGAYVDRTDKSDITIEDLAIPRNLDADNWP